jgi:hypothetical protein
MAAPESTKFQVNFKSPDGTLINLYASNKEELEALLTAAQDFSTLIASVSQSFSGAPAAAPVQPTQFQRQVDDRFNPPVAAVASGNQCKHGSMQYKEGVSAKGPWKGYMCAAPKGAVDKCPTIWVR